VVVALEESNRLAVFEGEAPRVSDDVGDDVSVGDVERVLVGEEEGVSVGEGVGVGEDVKDEVPVPERLNDCDIEGVFEGLAPIVSDPVGDTEMVVLSLCVVEGVKEPVPVPVPVDVPVGEGVEEEVGDKLGVVEALPETEALAPVEREAVGEEDTVEVVVSVVVGVMEAVPVLEAVEDAVGVAVGVCVPVELLEKDTLAEVDGDAPIVSDPVGDTEMVELSLREVEGVTEPVPVPVPVGVLVKEAESELLGELEGEVPRLKDAVPLLVTLTIVVFAGEDPSPVVVQEAEIVCVQEGELEVVVQREK